MRKNTFYRCAWDSDKKITAIKTTGYSENDIGVHKEDGFWVATHIPTGLLLTPKTSRNKTTKQTLNEAKKIIENHMKNPDRIQFAIKQFETNNIEYQLKNESNGHFHCRRKSDDKLFQFWAGTGKILGCEHARGIHTLIKLLNS